MALEYAGSADNRRKEGLTADVEMLHTLYTTALVAQKRREAFQWIALALVLVASACVVLSALLGTHPTDSMGWWVASLGRGFVPIPLLWVWWRIIGAELFYPYPLLPAFTSSDEVEV
ncbi:uncharacterized protein ACA1_055530 [Acanthamoeba castellanii str. Neff]|jgi:O-antigen ligase|uniref:Transmembrane protein n=1 Tax=Acanthamoeba castellanii (strain ATCC 30010 / Neff) TaxID=1257118 RepID=L8H6C5_ACACF|nr:uncharacterized protein ACA1_055530 [Acanthamoeba castellanii str. Neff]ELR20787.1 hypothetical protein ACA1_055530 [Acanthamoeba castellanii str. Neff]